MIGTTKPDFNFTGLYNHAKSGLDITTYRFYDPDLGRWLNRDPMQEEGGLNLYAYVTNQPAILVDPLGLCDFYSQLDLDLVPRFGIDVNLGLKLDFDGPWNTGWYLPYGPAAGGSAGAAVGFGYAARDIEGESLNFDVNRGLFSTNISFDDKGLNSGTVTIGPGGGASSSATTTNTLSIRTILNYFKKPTDGP